MREEILENIYNSKRNIIIDGDMATGKTSNIGFNLVDKMISSEENLFILDSREEYLNKYYKLLKEKNYNIIIINMKDYDKSNGWNMLEYPYSLYKNNKKDYAIKYLDKIVEEIFIESSGADPFWVNSAGDYFKGIALSLFEDAKKGEVNLNSINSIISETVLETKIDYVSEYFRTKNPTNMSYVCASGTVFSPIETKGGIVATAKQKLTPLVNKSTLNILLSKSTFELESILNRKNAIFFINTEDDSSLSSLTSIFICQLYSILIDNNNVNNFNFVLDNFDTINNINNLNGMLSASIANKIKFYIFTRDKELLEKKYSTYINKVSNSINLVEDKVNVRINNFFVEFINEVNNNIIKHKVEYPTLSHYTINIFNLKNFILKNFKVSDN